MRKELPTELSGKSQVFFSFLKSISSVQSLSHVQFFVTPWIAAHQASLSITNSRSSPKLMCIESVRPSSHRILCHPLLLLTPIPPSIRVFSNESTLLRLTIKVVDYLWLREAPLILRNEVVWTVGVKLWSDDRGCDQRVRNKAEFLWCRKTYFVCCC